MTWLWIPHASSRSSTYECVGPLRTFHPLLTSRFTFQHLPALVFCLFCVVVWFCCFGVFLFPVFALLCFWFLFCKCLGIPNSPRSLDLDDRQGLIARSAMQQKKKKGWLKERLPWFTGRKPSESTGNPTLSDKPRLPGTKGSKLFGGPNHLINNQGKDKQGRP